MGDKDAFFNVCSLDLTKARWKEPQPVGISYMCI